MYEIIEILGILLDNAFENIMFGDENIRLIKLDMIESNEEIRFTVANPARYFTSSEIENMFKRGYSSKGKNRGIGLARVRELLVEHKQDIRVRNYTYLDVNWLEFEVIVIK